MKIIYLPIFVRTYKKLPERLKLEVKEKIELFIDDQFHPYLKTHKLKGALAGRWSFSVNYDYRIIFRYVTKNEIALLAIGDHSLYD